MGLSLFLAQLIGIYMLIVAAFWLLRKEHLNKMVKEIFSSKGLIAFSGFFDLLFGLAIVLAHPIWEFNWRVVITLLGYIAIFRGILRFAYTDQVQKFTLKVIQKGYWIIFAIITLLGLFLTYHGFRS